MWNDKSCICGAAREFRVGMGNASICLCAGWICGDTGISEIYSPERNQEYGKIFDDNCCGDDWILYLQNGKIFSVKTADELLLWKYFISYS